MKRWALLIGVAIVAALIVWLSRRDDRPKRVARSRSRLDAAAFRVELARRVERAKAIAPKPAAHTAAARNPKWPLQGIGATGHPGEEMRQPCILGPVELCDAIAPLLIGCDAGDARDCLAVGDYLVDTPPRVAIATVFFGQACFIGDADGCERYYGLQETSKLACADDPLACQLRGLKEQNPKVLDEACALGAGDACVMAGWLLRANRELERDYNIRACQLGLSIQCADLARRLSDDCEPREDVPCYEPDEEQRQAALEIACAAGWDGDCD